MELKDLKNRNMEDIKLILLNYFHGNIDIDFKELIKEYDGSFVEDLFLNLGKKVFDYAKKYDIEKISLKDNVLKINDDEKGIKVSDKITTKFYNNFIFCIKMISMLDHKEFMENCKALIPEDDENFYLISKLDDIVFKHFTKIMFEEFSYLLEVSYNDLKLEGLDRASFVKENIKFLIESTKDYGDDFDYLIEEIENLSENRKETVKSFSSDVRKDDFVEYLKQSTEQIYKEFNQCLDEVMLLNIVDELFIDLKEFIIKSMDSIEGEYISKTEADNISKAHFDILINITLDSLNHLKSLIKDDLKDVLEKIDEGVFLEEDKINEDYAKEYTGLEKETVLQGLEILDIFYSRIFSFISLISENMYDKNLPIHELEFKSIFIDGIISYLVQIMYNKCLLYKIEGMIEEK